MNFMGYARLNVLNLPEGFQINTVNHRATISRSVDKIARSIVQNGIQMSDPSRGLIIAGRMKWISTRLIQSVGGQDPSAIPILEFSKEGLAALHTEESFVGCGGSHRIAASKQVHSQASVSIGLLRKQIALLKEGNTSVRKEEKLEQLQKRLDAALQLLEESKYWLVLFYDKGVCVRQAHLPNLGGCCLAGPICVADPFA